MPILNKFGIIAGVGVDVLEPEIINITVGDTFDTIGTVSFQLVNTMAESVRIFYSTASPPDTLFVDLGPNATSSVLQITGLAENQQHTLFAKIVFDNEDSDIVSEIFNTLQIGYAISADPTTLNETTIRTTTLTITTTNFGSGTLYWTIEELSGTINNADFSSPANAVSQGGSVTITNNSGTFTLQVATDTFTEGEETFRVQLRTLSTSGTIVANSQTITITDTSLTPVTSTPGIQNTSSTTNSISFRVRNNDALSATIFTRRGTSGTWDNRGSVASNGLTGTLTYSGLSASTTYTVQAYALASGKTDSAIAQTNITTAAPAPNFVAPNFPTFTTPNFPNFIVPNFPNFIVPNFPNFIVPNFPNFIVPNFPNFTAPSFTACPPAGTFLRSFTGPNGEQCLVFADGFCQELFVCDF